MERRKEYNCKEEEFFKGSRGRKVMEVVGEGMKGEGRKEGEEMEARKNSKYKKAIGIVFWNIAGVKKRQRFLGLFRKV